MFTRHPDFVEVEEQQRLWRYQDLPRYLDLLLRKQLFFNRIDKFEDPFEGRYNKWAREALALSDAAHEVSQAITALADPAQRQVDKDSTITVNTWHANADENYAMWNIYARGTFGLAIQTTFQRLKDSFAQAERPVYIGKVLYYDETCNDLPADESFIPFLRKRRIYEYENEVRCCSLVSPRESDVYWEEQGDYSGVFIDVDLHTMVERIYISPYSPKWFRDLIGRLHGQFNLQVEVIHSAVFHSDYF